MTGKPENIQREHYDAVYKAAGSRRPYTLHEVVISFLNACPVPENTSVLDIGAGRGELLDRLPRTWKKYAVDISEEAARQLSANGVDAVCIDLDETGLPYDSDVFDRICCLEVIEHLIRPADTLREIRRTLKPSGVFIASVPNIYQLCTLPLYFADIPPVNSARYGHIHVNDFTARLFKKALRENGFVVRRLVGDEIFPLTDPISRWVARRVPRLAHHLIAVCERAP